MHACTALQEDALKSIFAKLPRAEAGYAIANGGIVNAPATL